MLIVEHRNEDINQIFDSQQQQQQQQHKYTSKKIIIILLLTFTSFTMCLMPITVTELVLWDRKQEANKLPPKSTLRSAPDLNDHLKARKTTPKSLNCITALSDTLN